MKLIFCNIGWMARYEGRRAQADRIVGGGRYVDENEHGGEVCNFLSCDDGYVYGHVETYKGDPEAGGIDREIDIRKLGADAQADFADGINVVWTAKHPLEGGRRVVGWYRNARVFRTRQSFHKSPSRQHRKDGLRDYRIRAKQSDAVLIGVNNRSLRLQSGKTGWMGHAQWWFPEPKTYTDVASFIAVVCNSIESDGKTSARRELQDLGRTGPIERDYFKRLIRDRQPAFRKLVMEAYSGKCILTGCAVAECLEAAHIDRYSQSGNDMVTNGILLRADLHRLFDAQLLRFSWHGETLVAEIDESVQEQDYKARCGIPVSLPANPAYWPSRKAFKQAVQR